MNETKNTDHPQAWKVHSRKTIYRDPWVSVAALDVETPGHERFDYRCVQLPEVAVAAVVDDMRRVLMLWRYRVLPQRWGWELPGGIIDEGEAGADAATRETEEETGWRPNSMHHLITYQPTIGLVDAAHHIYGAHGARRIGEPTDPLERGRVEWISLSKIPQLLQQDQLMSSGTLIGLLHVLTMSSTET
ncbi:8-oxo-dGTP pyrophosphatase MutT (NUDIX family) [Catenuloplanes nepalensis]|uniref:8-oxo-dGTP pyrophosphatase MutT (NUDIX family) n=1 Tax=Catenuloplanes nepalensis TaxID=587533 RepID=A0ABT9MX41_9ACTN|nr:NUDIX hydrolase [Catenuloplanes nepalensis]MDP9795811.1 8-oxo-dGTP pyrophosphatase MutT (NUDIX family) [Catenuloplanes nepalensis]